MNESLIIPAFIAGFLTFLAPCTLPLVPGYLAFISGVSLKDLQDPVKLNAARIRIFLNGLFYVVGFSSVFIVFGTIFGVGGVVLSPYRPVLSRIGGVFVILFGLYMLRVLKLPFFRFLDQQKKFSLLKRLKPGSPFASFLFGATFAFGWTPCVGPILSSILFLASFSETFIQGTFLLGVFSLGLGIPFLIVAVAVGWFSRYLPRLRFLSAISSFVGGAFLVFLGVLLITNSFGWWLSFAYRLFDFISYNALLDFL